MMTRKYLKEDTKCTYQEAENTQQCFLLVTLKEREKFIVILTSQLSDLLHTVVTQELWLSLGVRFDIFTKTSNIINYPRKAHNPSRTRRIKRHIICLLHDWTKFGNVQSGCVLGQIGSWLLISLQLLASFVGSRSSPVCVKSWVSLYFDTAMSKTLASGPWENIKAFPS